MGVEEVYLGEEEDLRLVLGVEPRGPEDSVWMGSPRERKEILE